MEKFDEIDLVIDYSHDPLINIVYEEALFEHVRNIYMKPVVRIWLNPRSVVIGRSLEWCEEVYCENIFLMKIPLIRRFTGGGAVYHDLGNINISFAKPYKKNSTPDLEKIFREATEFIIEVLREIGLEAYVENMSDVIINGHKISGTAAAIRRGGYFYHSTLLVSSDIELLKKLVKPRIDRVLKGEVTPAKYNPANLSSFKDIDVREVMNVIIRVLEKKYKNIVMRRFSEEENKLMKKLHPIYIKRFQFNSRSLIT